MLDLSPQAVWPFVLVTVVLGGAAAWLAGRAIAQSWRPWWQAVLYMFVLGGAIRFIHYALFDGALLSLTAYGLDTAVAIVVATAGFRMMRARQMATNYGFLTAAASPPQGATPRPEPQRAG